MLNDILNCGVTTVKHNDNIKKRSYGKTIKGWTSALVLKEKTISEAKQASDCGSSIRQYVSSSAKDSEDNKCEFATRLLGANNRALSIPTNTGNREVFPSNSIKIAKDIFSALVEAVRTDTTVQLSIVKQLNGKGFKGKVEDILKEFNKEVTQ